ncbi:MAG: NAD(+) synthetase, partial [Methanobacteriota archaeon]
MAELVPRFKEEQVFIIEAFLVHSFRESGRKGVVLGLSGGIDSALVAKLCADSLGPQHVLGVAMPDGRGGKDLKDAKKFAK